MVPTLYGRQAIRLGTRCLVVSPNGYVICGVAVLSELSVRLSTSPYNPQSSDCLGVIWSSLTGN